MRSSLSNLLLCMAMLAGVGCAKAPAPEFSADAAWQHLLKQCEFGPRVPATPQHAETVRYLVRTMDDHGATVRLQNFEVQDPYASRKIPMTNIVGSYFPDRHRRVMLCAHFDTRPRADQETVDSLKTRPILGANDSASGVAVLLEIGRLITQQPPPDIGVDIVFFDGEDYGKESDIAHYLIGSKYFAANLGGYRPDCAILLDMVAGKGAKIRRELNSLAEARPLVDNIFARAERLGLDVFVPERGSAIIDDHVPLLRAGIPSIDLIGLPYPQWHTLGDTPEACSPETMRQVGTLLLDFLYDFKFES